MPVSSTFACATSLSIEASTHQHCDYDFLVSRPPKTVVGRDGRDLRTISHCVNSPFLNLVPLRGDSEALDMLDNPVHRPCKSFIKTSMVLAEHSVRLLDVSHIPSISGARSIVPRSSQY